MKSRTAAVLGLCSVLVSSGLALAEPDRKGSKDHPLISRMPSFHIVDYKTTEFDSQRFIGQDKKPVSIEGRKTYIQYNLDKGAPQPGELTIRRNLGAALQKIGGKVVFDDNFNRVSTIVLQKDGKEIWVEVRAFPTLYRQTIVERGAMKQEVVADAAAMGRDLDASGRVAVYGIYFDTNKTELKPESGAALTEIAKLLKSAPALKVHIVGHTDSVGSLDANLKLSKGRAASVVKALTGKYGIAAARLKAHGVASLAPVASNDTEGGKAKNRRVELVKQ